MFPTTVAARPETDLLLTCIAVAVAVDIIATGFCSTAVVHHLRCVARSQDDLDESGSLVPIPIDVIEEHPCRSDPKGAMVKRPVDDKLLLRLTVQSSVDHLIQATLEVTVLSWRDQDFPPFSCEISLCAFS